MLLVAGIEPESELIGTNTYIEHIIAIRIVFATGEGWSYVTNAIIITVSAL